MDPRRLFMESDLLNIIIQLLSALKHLPIPVGFIPPAAVWVGFFTAILGAKLFFFDVLYNPNPVVPLEYDFIVVGSGSAGAVIANRLTENGKFTVLLLEAGGEPTFFNSVPSAALFNCHHPSTDWMYNLVPQEKSCLSYPNQVMPYPRGKTLGGSTTLNFMVYQRGNAKDYEGWVNATGDSQWSYANALPFFKKSENYQGNYVNLSSSRLYHGTGGPLDVSQQSFQPLYQTWMAAGKELGYSNGDPNGIQTQKFSAVDVTTSDGTREGTYSAFLEPIFKRKNFQLYRNAKVTKVILDSANRATGVTFERFGKQLSATAKKEVIISAGAIGSPHLLMLSGVGPADHLRSVGIEPKIDLPGVGSNLHDHVHTFMGPFVMNDSVSFIFDRDLSIESVLQYTATGTGPLSWTTISGIGYFATPGVQKQWPNMQAVYFPIGIHRCFADDISAFYGIKKDSLQEYLNGYVGKDANWVLLNVARPKTSGTVRLQDAAHEKPPLIDPKYFEDRDDMKSLVEGMKVIVKVFEQTKAFGQYDAHLISNAFPGCEQHPLKSDAYYECYARHFTGTTWHPSGTCRMGKASGDPMAVVDSKLRVIGAQNLRVSDTSVMPQTTNGNLNAPTIMIAEKTAVHILDHWKKQPRENQVGHDDDEYDYLRPNSQVNN